MSERPVVGDRGDRLSSFTEQFESSPHIEPTSNVDALMAARESQERQPVARCIVNAPAPEAGHQANDERFAVGMTRACWRGNEAERLVEPRLDNFYTKSRLDNELPAVDRDGADESASPPTPIGSAFDERQYLVVDAILIDPDSVVAWIEVSDSLEPCVVLRSETVWKGREIKNAC